MKRYIKNGKIKNNNQIIIHKDGKQIINPKEEQILADGWVEYVIPELTEEQKLQKEKDLKKLQIKDYDTSERVNEFTIQGMSVWLDKETRAGLMLRLDSETAVNKQETTLWYNGYEFTLPIQQAKQMLYAIEVYASECYDNTQRHLAVVNGLESIDEITNYDFTTGYPEKLVF